MEKLSAAQIVLVRLEVLRRHLLDGPAFVRKQPDPQRLHDPVGDFVLHGEHVGEVPIVALRPQMPAGLAVDQLCDDPDAPARLADAPLQHVAYAQLFAQLLQLHGRTLVGERRIARGHIQARDPGEVGDEILGNAVAEVLLLRIAAHVDERQDHDGRGGLDGRLLRLSPLAVADLDLCHEAEAAAMQRADDLLVVPGVVDGLPRGLDSAAEGQFRNEAPLPDFLIELVLRDCPVAVLQEIAQEVEDLRLDGPEDALAAQFVPLRVQLGIAKSVDH